MITEFFDLLFLEVPQAKEIDILFLKNFF